ncbi:MAG: helix-turn-helix domain-containing protein [Pirellulaceae bacterium]
MQIDNHAMQVLSQYNWPGNVRQLRNVVERMTVTHNADEITAQDLPQELTELPREKTVRICTLAEATEVAERDAINAALAACDYHRDQTAKQLGVSVRTLHYKMSRYGLH